MHNQSTFQTVRRTFASRIGVPTSNALNNSAELRSQFQQQLRSFSVSTVKKLALSGTSRVSRLACHELAANRGFCYLRIVKFSCAKKLLAACRKPEAPMWLIQKMRYKHSLPLTQTPLKREITGVQENGQFIYHISFNPTAKTHNFKWSSFLLNAGCTVGSAPPLPQLAPPFVYYSSDSLTGTTRDNIATRLMETRLEVRHIITILMDLYPRVTAPGASLSNISAQMTAMQQQLNTIQTQLSASGPATVVPPPVTGGTNPPGSNTPGGITVPPGNKSGQASLGFPLNLPSVSVWAELQAGTTPPGVVPPVEESDDEEEEPTVGEKAILKAIEKEHEIMQHLINVNGSLLSKILEALTRKVEVVSSACPFDIVPQASLPSLRVFRHANPNHVFGYIVPDERMLWRIPLDREVQGSYGSPLSNENLGTAEVFLENATGTSTRAALPAQLPGLLPDTSFTGELVSGHSSRFPLVLSFVNGVMTGVRVLGTTAQPSVAASPALQNNVNRLLGVLGFTISNNLEKDVKDALLQLAGITAQASLKADASPQEQSTLTIQDVEHVMEHPNIGTTVAQPSETTHDVIDPWTIKEVLTRPILIKKANWSPTQGQHHVFFNSAFPNSWFDKDSDGTIHIQRILRMFNMVKMDVVFRLTANATPMYGGILALYFDFFNRHADGGNNVDAFTASNFDPVYLDLSKGSTVEIKVPYSAVSQFLSPDHRPFASEFLGNVYVVAMSDLSKPATAPNVELRLYSYLSEVDVAVLQRYRDDSKWIVPQADIVKTITSFAHSWIPGMKTVYPLALEEHYALDRAGTCRVEEIGSVYSLLYTRQWNTTMESDTELMSIKVHPMEFQLSTAGDIVPAKIGHLGRHFCMWNGSLEYRIQVACSNLHSGKLMVVFVPGSIPNSKTTTGMASNPHILLDVKETHEIEVTMPFVSPTAWKPTYITNPFGDLDDTKVGTIRIINADSIKSALELDTKVTVNVYMKCGKDFQYAVPRNGLQSEGKRVVDGFKQLSITSVKTKLHRSMEDFNDLYKLVRRFVPLCNVNAKNSQMCLIPIRPIIPLGVERTPLSILSRGFAFWRGSMNFKIKVTAADDATFEVIHNPMAGIPTGLTGDPFVLRNPTAGWDAPESGAWAGSQTFHPSRDKEWEITIPYYSIYDWLYLPTKEYKTTPLPFLSTNNGLLVIRPMAQNVTYSVVVSMSCGTDFEYACPTAFPRITPLANSATGKNAVIVPKLQGTIEPQGVLSFFEKLGDNNSIMNNILSTLNADLEEGSVEWMVRVIRGLFDSLLKDLTSGLKELFLEFKEYVDWTTIAGSLACALLMHKFWKDGPIVTRAILTVVSGIVSHEFIHFLMRWFQELIGGHIRVQNDLGSSVSLLIQLCTGIFAYYLAGSTEVPIPRLIKNLGDIGRSFVGMKTGADTIQQFSLLVQSQLDEFLSPSEALAVKSIRKDAVEVIERAHRMTLEEVKTKHLSNMDARDEVLKLYDAILEIYQGLIATNASTSVSAPVSVALKKMAELRDEVYLYRGAERYRLDPMHISLYGGPGVGKSAAMNQIAEDFRAVFDWPHENLVYARNMVTEYWDGYRGQSIVTYDDLAQIVMDGECDVTEMIGIKSNAPYPVHMASIKEKGQYFSSKLLISSTNVKCLNNFPGLRNPDAFHRRRNVLVEVTKVEEFDDTPELQHLRFQFCDSITGQATHRFPLTYAEFMERVLEEARVYYATQDKLVKMNTTGARHSSVAEAILRARPIEVEVQGDVKVTVEEEIQSLPSGMAAALMARLQSAGKSAARMGDFSLLAGSLTMVEKLNVMSYIQGFGETALSAKERLVVNQHRIFSATNKAFDAKYSSLGDAVGRVSEYLGNMWQKIEPERKKQIATALTGLGVVAVAAGLYKMYPFKNDVEENDIPKDIFTEGDDSYKSKDRNPPKLYKLVGDTFVESGIDEERTRRGQARKFKITKESGIDEERTRRGNPRQFKIVKESAEDFPKWSQEHPGVIPNKFDIDNAEYWEKRWFGWVPKAEMFKPENYTQAWNDYVDYCKKVGHPNHYTIPELRVALEGELGASTTKSFTFGNFGVSEQIKTATLEELHEELDKPTTEVMSTNRAKYNVPVDAQYRMDPESSELVERSIDNMALVGHVKSDLRMRALLLSDRFMVVPAHFFLLEKAEWEHNDEFVVHVHGTNYRQSFDRKRLYVVPNRDIAVYLLTARVAGARSILSRILTEHEHSTFKQVPGMLAGLGIHKNTTEVFLKTHVLNEIMPLLAKEAERVVYELGKTVHQLNGYRYHADTENGDCGSLLVQQNKFKTSKILGLHVAAARGYSMAYAEMLVREEVEKGIAALTTRCDYIPSGSTIQTVDILAQEGIMVQSTVPCAVRELDERYDLVGALPGHMQKKPANKTDIVPSALQGVLPFAVRTEPAVLDHRDPRANGHDPLVVAFNKYSLDCKPFDNAALAVVKDHMINYYSSKKATFEKKVLSLDEALNGVPEAEFADSMNMNTAEGMLWGLDRPRSSHSKEWMFEQVQVGNNLKWKITHRPLLESLVHRLKEAREGRRVASLTTESIKDERRSLKKTRGEVPGTRSFTIMPVDYNILVRQYFLAFAVMIMNNRHSGHCQVGINPTGIEWTSRILRLLATSDVGFAGDFKNFDGQECAELMDMVCDVINAWYNDGPVNAQVRKVLMGEAYDRCTIVHGQIVLVEQGLPSGFPLTAIINSINNDAYKYLAWLDLAPLELKTLGQCDRHVDSLLYGDDNNHAISHEVIDWFNLSTVGGFLAKHGITLTDADKNHWTTAQKQMKVEDMTFLKRHFRRHPERPMFFLAPIEKQTIEERLLWQRTSKFQSEDEILLADIEASLKDAFHWGREYFDWLKTEIRVALETVGKPDLTTFVSFVGEDYKWMQTVPGINGENEVARRVLGF